MSVAEDLKNGTVSQIDGMLELERRKRAVRRQVDAEERRATAARPPEILTLRERLARPHSPVKWRVSRVQAVGHRVLLAAQYKAGKTTLAANLVRSVLDGDPFLGIYDVAAIDGAVALFDFEMSDTQLDDWYADQQIHHDDRLVVIAMRGAASSFDIMNPDVRAEWVAKLKTHRVAYLILDCLRPVLDALGLNEHTQVGLFLTAFDELLREAGIPEALVIQHMGHKNERARGDSRLLDWPDVGWTLTREDDDDPASPRYFRAYGRDVEVPESQLAYDTVTRRLVVANADEGGGVSRADAKTHAALAAVCQFLEGATEPQSKSKIEQGVRGHKRDVVRKAIELGVECGAVVTVEGGKGGGLRYQSALTGRPSFALLDNSASPPNSAELRQRT